MNNYTVVGNLTKDVSCHESKNGNIFITGTIADNVGYGENKKVLFIDFIWFNDKMAQHLVKGKLVFAYGTLEPDTWTDKEGKEHKRFKLVVKDMSFVGGGKPKDATSKEHKEYVPSSESDTDIPF